MNTINNTVKTASQEIKQSSLPPLVKASTSYKLFVPRNVEEKIRYLIRKFPSTEWSGVLFYNHTGSFEQGDLEIHCQDIFPMDLGSGTFTDFKMDESVVGYIADNIDLFGCDTGLVHSHHYMGAFFSGTDTSTLRTEGNDTNCFVSLIVDTKGTYQAAITRKVQAKKEIITKYLDTSYEFFGEGTKYMGNHSTEENQTFVDDTIIEYFMLDVEIEHVDNPLAYLDTRFEEIQKNKQKLVTNITKSSWLPQDKYVESKFGTTLDSDYSFRDYRNKKQETESTLFSEEEMGEVTDTSEWEPDPTIIHRLVVQMVTCSLIINDSMDLKQWMIRWMNTKYKELFGSHDSVQFDNWKEFIVEFMINQYEDTDVPATLYDDWDLYNSKIANAMYEELSQYNLDESNLYINGYMEILMRYMYE